jgi:hypothetical protein
LGTPLTTQHDETLRLSDDPNDYYKFTIDKTLGIGVSWTSTGGTPPVYPNSGSTTKIELLRSNGTLVTSQNGYYYGGYSSLGQNLDAGTYYLRFNTDSTATVNYDFTLVAVPGDNVGNDSDHAKDLGTIGATPISQSDYVYSINSGDSYFTDKDYYQFTLSQPSQVTFNLTNGDNSYTSLSLLRNPRWASLAWWPWLSIDAARSDRSPYNRWTGGRGGRRRIPFRCAFRQGPWMAVGFGCLGRVSLE